MGARSCHVLLQSFSGHIESPGWPLIQVRDSRAGPKIFKLGTRGRISPSWPKLLDMKLDNVGDSVAKYRKSVDSRG